MVGLKGMKDGRAILRIRAAIPWFFQGEGRWEAERRGSPPLPLFFLPFNPPLVWLNSARGTGKRFFYLISLPLLGEGTGAICLLLLSLSLLLTFFFFFFFFVSLFEQVWQKKELGELEMENDFLPGSVVRFWVEESICLLLLLCVSFFFLSSFTFFVPLFEKEN